MSLDKWADRKNESTNLFATPASREHAWKGLHGDREWLGGLWRFVIIVTIAAVTLYGWRSRESLASEL